jgi:hypothetical protein
MTEFLARDGLCDTLVAQMNPHFNEIDAPPDEPTPYVPSTYSAPPPAYQPPGGAPFQFRCFQCGNAQIASPPPSVRSFFVRCGSCGAQNQVQI